MRMCCAQRMDAHNGLAGVWATCIHSPRDSGTQGGPWFGCPTSAGVLQPYGICRTHVAARGSAEHTLLPGDLQNTRVLPGDLQNTRCCQGIYRTYACCQGICRTHVAARGSTEHTRAARGSAGHAHAARCTWLHAAHMVRCWAGLDCVQQLLACRVQYLVSGCRLNRGAALRGMHKGESAACKKKLGALAGGVNDGQLCTQELLSHTAPMQK